MHELAITESIVEIALKAAEQSGARRVVEVHLRIGEMSHIAESILVQFIHHLSRGTIMEGVKVSIEWSPIILRCSDCETSFETARRDIVAKVCPSCSGKNFSIASGREFSVESIEVI